MSSLEQSAPVRDFDFWEFVCCSKCHLSYIPDAGGPPTVPFWVTECGHVICNNHLRSDHRCAKCGATNVQVAALQQEMEPPMSNWFTPVPQAFDALAYTARFQIEALASLVRYYKKKCAHQRGLIERLRPLIQEHREMKGIMEDLRTKNDRLQMYMDTSNIPNANGKRQMLSRHAAHANSSPLSVNVPIAPDRLTLPPEQQRPGFHERQHHSDDGPRSNEGNRPGSRRFIERYAYNAPTSREGRDVLPPNLSHAQLDPVRRSQNRHLQHPVSNSAHISTGDDPRETSDDYRPAHLPHSYRQHDRPNGDAAARMPPPALPLNVSHGNRAAQSSLSNSVVPPSTPRHRTTIHLRPQYSAGVSSRHATTQSGSRAATPSIQTQRFVPSVPSTPSTRNFSPLASNAAGPSSAFSSGRAQLEGNPNSRFRMPSSATSSGQRSPFVPGQRGL
ncbi:hypothetical protein PHLGIDRAFT_388983 [Phlebiopsis gigantea 11061_1 CR5-6]|uniref:Uncharacterized protein n=1 Tax=Phlebiopsis gigantea (strain 11061_1 CR5-6) TaxID=745531 RepID=A0A0C3PN18_PHLG1|nr:hypothetical protein PHLGIDRAFT_388983 [Phlebiopsis gigantea 11061_1 CR5-6]